MKIRLSLLKDARKWVDKQTTLKDLMVILMLGKEQAYSIKKYLDGYEVFAGSTKVGSVDKFGNLTADDAIYFQYKQKAKTEKDKLAELTAQFNSDEAVEEAFPTAVVEEYLNTRSQEEAVAAAGAARNKAITGSEEIFKKRYGNKIRLANGETKTAREFAEYLYNTYKKNRVFDKWYKIITVWYIDGILDESKLDHIRAFIDSVNMLAADHYNEYDENFNNLTPDEIIKRFSKNAKEAASRERAESAKTAERKTDYEIVKITSQTEAKKYAPYTSWCVTRGSFSGYCELGNPGKAEVFYFMLKKGYQQVEAKRGPGAPKDEYGLSMIAVSVKENGELFTSTTRWNHDMGGNDNAFTPRELGELAGGDFYKIFKPITSAEEMDNKIINSSSVIRSAKGGDNRIVSYGSKLYLINGDKIVKDEFGYNLIFGLAEVHKSGSLVGRGEEGWLIINSDLVLVFEGPLKEARKVWNELNKAA